ncbi:MAG: hypothetical protein ACJA1A_001854, partial [Saprospiraceae bacterium]
MCHFRYSLLSVLFFLFGLNNISAQVTGVDFLLEYSIDSCSYIASIIVVEGNAIAPNQRAQFNSSYTVVVPFGSSLVVESSINPKLNNLISGNGTVPITWAISNFVEGPPVTPDLSYFTVIPDISVASFHNNTFLGDTIKLFSFSIDPLMDCGDEVRLFINGSDPNSSQMPSGLDYSCGFELGNDGQDYVGNRDIIGPPKPEVEFSIDCSSGVTIVSTPLDSLICSDQLPYTYMWSGPGGFSSNDENPILPANPVSGTYCATIVDNFGCDTIICEFLDVQVAPPINETLCSTDPYDLIYASGGSGNWVFDPSSNTTGASIGSSSNGTATVTFTAAATGLYSFIFENSGCGGTAIITIMPASSEPNVMDDGPKCPGEITTITADPIGGATYNWNNEGPQGNNTYQVGGPGLVSLEVIVGGCPSSTMIDVMYLDTPGTPTLDVNTPVCEGDMVNFTATNVTGAVNTSYQWQQLPSGNAWNEQNPSIPSVIASDDGTYQVIVTIDGCESAPTTVVLTVDNKPTTPIIDPIDDVCEGETIQFNTNASAATYTWTQQPPGGNILSGQSPSITGATAADAGTYILVINDGGCDSEPASVIVNVIDKPETPIIDATSPVCVGQEIQFTSTMISGATYAWFLDGTPIFNTQNHTISMAALSDAGTYTVIATVNGCDSDPATTIVVVNNTSAAPPATIESPVCAGNNVDFSTDMVPGATYTWTNATCPNSPIVSNDAAFTVNNIDENCAGTWELTVDLAGCISDPGMATLNINATPDEPLPTSNTDLCVGDDLMLFANETADVYEWYFGGFFISGDQNPIITGVTTVDAGTYSLIVLNSSCESEAGETVVVINEKPDVPDVSSNGPICTNEDIELFTSVIADSYTWTGPTNIEMTDKDPVYTGSAAIEGTYTLAVTIDGCESDPASINVMSNPTPSVPDIGANGPLCTGMNLQLSTDPVPGNVEYCWTGPDGFTSGLQNPFLGDVTIDADGIYQLIVKVDDCPSLQVSINVDIYQSPETPTASVNPICKGDDIQLMSSANPSLGHTWTYIGLGTNSPWSSIEANPTITDADAFAHNGEYVLVVTENGCPSDPDTVLVTVIELAEPTTGTYGPFCIDADPVTLTGSPVGIFTGDGVNVAGDMFDPNDAGAGTHQLTLTVTDGNGCAATSTVDVEVHDLPTITLAAIELEICIGESTTITAMGGDTYTWVTLPAGASHTVSPTTTTTYNVTGTDGNGCENTAEITITVNPLPTITLDATELEICVGESTTITAMGGDTYTWITLPNGASHTVSPTTTTTYN